MGCNILEVESLTKHFPTPKGLLYAVDNVTFSIKKGKTLGLVGESGCGKTTTGRCILRLLEPTSGKVIFDGKDVTKLRKKQIYLLRKEMQIIFQDPYSSLNPRMTVEGIISEPIKINKLIKNEKDIKKRVDELMDIVGLASRLRRSYPHELDGGRRQRIGVARALSLNPKFIVCDEPVSALDVSIQAQILNMLKELQKELDLTYLFITHDLSVVNHFSDDIAVMYLGKLIEKAPTLQLFENPLHPYTKALLSAIPIVDIDKKKERILIKGEIPSPVNLPDECRFAPRCNYVRDECFEKQPELIEVEPNHFVACPYAKIN
ncbi:MAG: ABC transporter ATP-binding protein [Firmicutes bacterium]|nr:ABC transporter ATP-binding protein [Bacillota bacterium]